jgi:hypothetical protein
MASQCEIWAARLQESLHTFATAQGNANPRVAPPTSSPYGLTYGVKF